MESSLERKCKATFKRMLDSLKTPGENSVTEYMSTIHSNFRGFGTTRGERFTNKEQLPTPLREAFRIVPGGFAHEIKWMDFKQLSESVAEIFVELTLELGIERGVVAYELIRVSAVFEKVGEEALITHFHMSAPEPAAAVGELFPGASEPKSYEQVSILFTDFVGFTNITSKISPSNLVKELNDIFSNFDRVMKLNHLTKIKTIGDAYMAAAGLEELNKDHAASATLAAQQILEFLKERNLRSEIEWNMRVGIHSGSVIGGVIGLNKLEFDLWGDTVNTAARIESSGEAGRVNISEFTYNLVKDDPRFSFLSRGKISAKNKGEIEMYYGDLVV